MSSGLMRDKIGTSSGQGRDQRPKLISGEIHPSKAHGSNGMLTHTGWMFNQCCCLHWEAQQIIIFSSSSSILWRHACLRWHFIASQHWPSIEWQISSQHSSLSFVSASRGQRGGSHIVYSFFVVPTHLFQHAVRHLMRSQRVTDQIWARATF